MPCVRWLMPLSMLTAAALAACSSDTTTNTFAPLALSLSLSPTPDTIFVSDSIAPTNTASLSVSAKSLNAPIGTPSGIEWSSSDPSVASVSEDGTITPHSIGSTTITARINSSKATATVVVAYRATKLSLTATSLNGIVGDTITVTASALDPKGTIVPGTAYVFSSADQSIASVTVTAPRTAQVVLRKAGVANVTITAAGQTTTITGTVSARDFIASPVTSAPIGSLVLSAGSDATCGLIAQGRGYCFGLAPVVSIAKDTSCFDERSVTQHPCSLIPLRIAGTLNLVSVAVGDSVACGATVDSHLYCWGDQTYGQLGNGLSKTGGAAAPSLVLAGGSTGQEPMLRVAVGSSHACGLSSRGTVYCWGRDDRGQLGNGDGIFDHSSTPIPVGGGIAFAALAAGGNHTCGLTSAGAAFCWGSNATGELGAGVFDSFEDNPVAVAGSSFTQITAGARHTCALTSAGIAFCWGDNSSGQLGDGGASGFESIVPVAVVGGLRFKSISAGRASTCGITTSGSAFCWGDNSYWQLGTSSVPTSASPSPVSGGRTDFVSVTVGARHACANATGGGAYCWGSNIFGALGNELQAMRQASPSRVVFP